MVTGSNETIAVGTFVKVHPNKLMWLTVRQGIIIKHLHSDTSGDFECDVKFPTLVAPGMGTTTLSFRFSELVPVSVTEGIEAWALATMKN